MMQPDGKRSVQWGTASHADTTTGPTDATLTPPQPLKDSTSASAAEHPFSPSEGSPVWLHQLVQDLNSPPLPDFKPVKMKDLPPLPESVREFSQLQEETTSALKLPAFTVGKQGYLVRITDDQLGMAEVWPVEVLSPEAEEAARKERELEQRQRLINITARLALAPEALHPIIELHSPDQEGIGSLSWETCTGCDAGAYAESSPDWPCRTIDLILEGLE